MERCRLLESTSLLQHVYATETRHDLTTIIIYFQILTFTFFVFDVGVLGVWHLDILIPCHC